MNRLLALLLATGLAAQAWAGPGPQYWTAPRPNTKPATSATTVASASTAEAASKIPSEIFVIWRGAPQNPTSGVVYVDASGQDFSHALAQALDKLKQIAETAAKTADASPKKAEQ